MVDEELIEKIYGFEAIEQMAVAPDHITIDLLEIKSLDIKCMATYVQKALAIGRFQDYRLQPGSGRHQMEVEWAYQVVRATGKPVLIIAPLVIQGYVGEVAKKAAINIAFPKTPEEVIEGINVINYEKLHKFDPSVFIGVAADVTGLLSLTVVKSKKVKLFPFLKLPTYHMLTSCFNTQAVMQLRATVSKIYDRRQDAGV
jgi:hypothetical protein